MVGGNSTVGAGLVLSGGTLELSGVSRLWSDSSGCRWAVAIGEVGDV